MVSEISYLCVEKRRYWWISVDIYNQKNSSINSVWKYDGPATTKSWYQFRWMLRCRTFHRKSKYSAFKIKWSMTYLAQTSTRNTILWLSHQSVIVLTILHTVGQRPNCLYHKRMITYQNKSSCWRQIHPFYKLLPSKYFIFKDYPRECLWPNKYHIMIRFCATIKVTRVYLHDKRTISASRTPHKSLYIHLIMGYNNS